MRPLLPISSASTCYLLLLYLLYCFFTCFIAYVSIRSAYSGKRATASLLEACLLWSQCKEAVKQPSLKQSSSAFAREALRMLAYACVCWRMLRYADVCWRMLWSSNAFARVGTTWLTLSISMAKSRSKTPHCKTSFRSESSARKSRAASTFMPPCLKLV